MSEAFFRVRWEGIEEYKSLLSNISSSAPEIMKKSLNDLAFIIRAKQQETIKKVFKNPRPSTIWNVKVKMASKDFMSAAVLFDQIFDGEEYIIPQVEGGQRKFKRSEKAFGRYYVPGAGAQIDKYGGMKGSQFTQILSRLKLFEETGWNMNSKKKPGKETGPQYFMLSKPTKGLPAGVYQRVDKGQGQMMVARAMATRGKGVKNADVKAKYRKSLERGIIPVMIFVKKPPTYKAIYPFYGVGQQVIADNAGAVIANAMRLYDKGLLK